MGVTKRQNGEETDVPPHVKLFNDVKNRLEVEKQVTFEESGRAFVIAAQKLEEPETRQFVDDVMIGVVEIFLNQLAGMVNVAVLFHFEDVLKSAAKIISWEIRTLKSIKRLELLGKILDESARIYEDKKILINGQRRIGSIRTSIIKDLTQDGTFTMLLQMLKGQVPIEQWAQSDFPSTQGKPAPSFLPLTARVINLLITPAFNSDVDRQLFADAAVSEISKNFHGETLKRQKAEELLELHKSLMIVYGSQDETFHEFSLSFWLRCFECDAFAVKKLGLENLIRVCDEARKYRTFSKGSRGIEIDRAKNPSPSPENPSATPSTTWDDARVCNWLVEKKVLQVLFGSGSQTHSALVARSKNLLEYMATAGALEDPQIDMIFQSSVGQHESARGAVHSLLAELATDLANQTHLHGDLFAIKILKRATIICSERPEDMFFFTKKLMQLEHAARNTIMTSRTPELPRSLLELLWTLLTSKNLSSDEEEAEQRRSFLLGEFNDALRVSVVPLPSSFTSLQKTGDKMNEDKVFQDFLSRCLAILQPENEQANEQNNESILIACSVIKQLILLHPDMAVSDIPATTAWTNPDRPRPEWTKKSQVEFVEELETSRVFSSWIVRLITRPDTPRRKMQFLLDFLRLIAERVRSRPCLDFENIRICASALHQFEDLKFMWLQDLVKVDAGKSKIISPEVTAKVFEELICNLSLDSLGTKLGFDCFAAYFEDVNHSSIFQTEIDSTFLGLHGLETLWVLAIRTPSQAVAQKASQMLLVLQRRIEESSDANGITFLEKIMHALGNSQSDEQKQRCISLASVYLETQEIPNPHAPVLNSYAPKFDLVLHHDDLLTYSDLDIGKAIEKRFREGKSYAWYPGYIFNYDQSTKEHEVWFRDGESKKYDMRHFAREGAIGDQQEKQYRMLSVASETLKPVVQPDQGKPFPPKVVAASKHYQGVPIALSEATTINELKTLMLEKLGREALLAGGVDESKLEIQIETETPPTIFPHFLQPVGMPKNHRFPRYRILNQSTAVGPIVSKFGAKLFLCMNLSGPTPPQMRLRSHENILQFISAEGSEYHARLMRLIQDNSISFETRKATWDLLMAIPSEQGLTRRALSANFDWVYELNQSQADNTLLGQIYLLQISERACYEILENPSEAERYQEFSKSFFTENVANSVIALFSRASSSFAQDEWEKGVSLKVLVHLLRYFVERNLITQTKELSRNLTKLILWDLGNSACKDDQVSKEEGATRCELSLTAFFIEMELANDSGNHPYLVVSDDDDGSSRSLCDVLLESHHQQIRDSAYRVLLAILKSSRSLVFSSVLKTLSNLPDGVTTCQTFFQFINEFVEIGTEEDITSNCQGLMRVVRSKLASYKLGNQGDDPALIGLLELYRRLVERVSSPSDELEIFDIVLRRFLFAVSGKSEDSITHNPSLSTGAKQRCFSLLKFLAQKSPQVFGSLIVKLDGFINQVQIPVSRAGRSWDFHFRADDTRRAPGTYVGLVNQGATCYQNSVLQQFFMRKRVRSLLLNATCIPSILERIDDEETPPSAQVSLNSEEPQVKKKPKSRFGLILQLQRIFSFLNDSDQKYFNPRMFVNNSSILRLTDGHMSQNDCIEFYSLMMDYFEEIFKNRPEREELRKLFVSSITSLTIRNCPKKHRSEKEESTFYISLSIRFGHEGRALNSLDEALEEWSKSEHLSDLLCEDCFPPSSHNDKSEKPSRFEADQVKFITNFPPILVLQLKRFDFDYETLQPTKLNHRVSFQQRIDLGRFTREAVLRQYEGAAEGEEPHVWYSLKGVVVHQGTGANFGHYYSFIEDDDSKMWFRFDDERVTPFDLNHLEEECFGGPITQNDASKTNTAGYSAAALAVSKRSGATFSGGLRNNNAYLLIYSKEESTPPSSTSLNVSTPQGTDAVSKLISKPLSLSFAAKLVWVLQGLKRRGQAAISSKQRIHLHAQQVWEDNQRTLRHSMVFAPDFLNFTRSLLSYSPSLKLSGSDEMNLATFAIDILTRIVIFAESEKDRLEIWFALLQQAFQRNEDVEQKVCSWFLCKITQEEVWIERMLVQCSEGRSSGIFTQLLLYMIDRSIEPKVNLGLAETLLKFFPKSSVEAVRFIDANYFLVLKALGLKRGEISAYLLEKDVIFGLVRLLDEKLQPQQSEERGKHESNVYHPLIKDERFYPKIIAVLDALCIEIDEHGEIREGFPLMPMDSSKALFSDSFFSLIVKEACYPGRRLIPKLCDCSTTRTDKCLEQLLHNLTTSQWPARIADAEKILSEVCTAYKLQLLSMDSENFRRKRDDCLNGLIKIARDSKRQAAERREILSSQYHHSNTYVESDRVQQYQAAVLLVMHVVDLINFCSKRSDSCRSFLKLPGHKLSSLVNAVDASSFERFLHGHEACGLRDPMTYGGIARNFYRNSIALSHLPRSLILPCVTLCFHVEDAGSIEVNGIYRFDGFFPKGAGENVDTETPKFVKVDSNTGKRFTIYRCSIVDQQLTWFISILSEKPGTPQDIDYYQSRETGSGLPDGRWNCCGSGMKPPPKATQVRGTPSPEENLLEYFDPEE